MREKRTFAERTKVLKSDEVRKQYFLIYEGSETEVIYFDAVRSLRGDIGINPLIRSFSEDGWSNPKKILDRVIENLRESREQVISYESLLNRIMDYLYETEVITTSKVLARSIWMTMERICSEQFQKQLTDTVEDIETACDKMMASLADEYEIINIVEDISEIIKNSGLTYDEGFDQICLIVDRDRDSFICRPEKDQYHYVLDKCRKFGFKFYVTNPNFEFWLLLHYDEVFELDKDKLLKNPKITRERRYTEHCMRKLYKGYKKDAYRANEFVKRIDKAIENEKQFCEDIGALEYSVGSNIGCLITELRQN